MSRPARRPGLDTIRGITLLSMMAYHACWDLVYMFHQDWAWYTSFGAYLWQQSICWTFILLSGYCFHLGRHPLRRGLLTLAASAVVSVGAQAAGAPIRWGVLTLLGAAALLTIPLERLLQEPLYLTEKGISYRYAVEQFLAEQGRELRPFWEVGSTDVITRFLLEGEGISLLPEFVVREHLEKGELVVLHPQCPPILMWSQLVYHRNKYVTPLMALFLDLMKQRLQGEGA